MFWLCLSRNEAWHLLNYVISLEAGRQPSQGELIHVEQVFLKLENWLEMTHGKRPGAAIPTHTTSQEGLGRCGGHGRDDRRGHRF